MKLPFLNPRARSIERAQREAEILESEAIRESIMIRVRLMDFAERNRPEKSRELEGALVEIWL
jgi:hypothetical protein